MNESMIQEQTFNGMTIRDVEDSIRVHITAFWRNGLDVGRDLIAAKALVAPGAWLEWLRVNAAGMSERSAERFMRVAKNVEPGSALEGLPVSKVELLLQMPEEAREAAAETARAENTSVRELRAQVKELQERLNGADRAHRVTMENMSLSRKTETKRWEEALEAKQSELNAARERNAKLEESLREMNEDGTLSAAAQGIVDALNAKVADLQREIDDVTEQAEEQAELRQRAEEENAQLRAGQDGGEADVVFALKFSVNTFLSTADEYRYRAVDMMRVTGDERADVAVQIRRVEAWCEAMRGMLAMAEDSSNIFTEVI